MADFHRCVDCKFAGWKRRRKPIEKCQVFQRGA